MIGSSITIKQLEALVWVADLGSFRKAADHLNTTQPNISSRIASLETTLNTTLMHRDAGSVRLTEKGRKILEATRSVLRQAETLLDVAGRPELVTDKLRLGVTELIACTWIREYLRDLRQAYPNLSVELTVDLSKTLDTELVSNAVDLTIQNTPFSSIAMGHLELGSHPYAWVASPETARPLPTRPRLEDLDNVTILTHARHAQAHIMLIEQIKKMSLRPRVVSSNSLTSCLHMAIDGMGLALIPHPLAIDSLKRRTLEIVGVDWLPDPLQFAARYHAERVPRFVAHAAELARERAYKYEAEIKGASM